MDGKRDRNIGRERGVEKKGGGERGKRERAEEREGGRISLLIKLKTIEYTIGV